MSNSSNSNDVAAAYDQWAATYDTGPNATRDLDAVVLREQGFDLSGCRVLEIGCGTGKNTRWLTRRAETVIAVDASIGMLARARRALASNPGWLRADLRGTWPVPPVSVDWVVGNLVLEHLGDLDGVFREVARVLRPSGSFYCCELHPFRQLEGGQAHFDHPESGNEVWVPAFRHDVSDYVNGALRAGLAIVRVDDWRDRGPDPQSDVPRLFSLRCRKR